MSSMSNLRQAAQQALEALERSRGITLAHGPLRVMDEMEEAITALRAALADGDKLSPGEPVQEPVAIVEQLWSIIDDIDTYTDMAKADDKLYRSLVERRQADRWKTGVTTDGYTLNIPSCSAPNQRKPLPASEIVTMYDESPSGDSDMIAFARAIEQAHGIKP